MLTVLDFISQHRKEFRFENQFRALTNLTRKRLLDHIEHDFPQLPSGCEIMLEEKAKRTIIANIKDQLSVNVTTLAREVAEYAEPRLSRYLEESGRELKEMYRGNGNSWTRLLRRAGLMDREAPEGEPELLKRIPAFLHVDDPLRVAEYTRMLEDDAPAYNDLDEQGKAYARRPFFQLWPLGGVDEEGLRARRRRVRHPSKAACFPPCVKSATQQRFGAPATKSRSTRSGARSACWSGIVVRTLLPRTAPAMPSSRISRSTVQRATA
ncbi:hypothetical protein SHIRM173S_01717 [Streptomyces hirsutus]